MIDFDEAISIIRRNGGFKPNRKDTSYYRTYTIEGNRPLQARISNHGTWLWTWYDKDYDPSYAINFCIVFGNNIEIAPTLSQITSLVATTSTRIRLISWNQPKIPVPLHQLSYFHTLFVHFCII